MSEIEIKEKRFPNQSGDLSIRKSGKQGCGIVEIMHFWNKNKSGCVVGCWRIKKSIDPEITYAQFESIDSRFVELKLDDDFDIMALLKCGQRLADFIVEFTEKISAKI